MKQILVLSTLLLLPIHLFSQWTAQTSGTTNNLFDVFFTDNNVGYAVGENGTILNTTDGGVNWTGMNSGVTGYLHGITFTNATTGFAVGENGVILKTTNAGASWTLMTSGTTTNLLDVSFADNNTGYVVGWTGEVLKTTDGGTTWVSANNGINTTVNLTGVFFTSANVGYITGLSGFLYETTDGGANWNFQSNSVGGLNLFETYFVNTNVGFAVGENSALLKTVDAGTNWTSVTGGGIVLKGVYFTDVNKGYAVGNYQGTGIIRETSNGGANWNITMSGGSNQNNVHFPSASTGYAVGNNGEIRKLVAISSGTDVITACDSLEWIDGITYYSDNNTATDTIPNGAANGNDSIVTLDLTILHSATGTDVRSECSPFVWVDGNTYTNDNNTASYTINGGAANGCDSTVYLDLTINTVDVTTTQTEVSITANASGAEYHWLDCTNGFSEIPGETGQTFTATSNGNYAVEITSAGCVDTSACVTINSVGLPKSISVDHVSILPNPAYDQITIIPTSGIQSFQIKMYNALGKCVFEETVTKQGEFKLDASNIESGIYTILIKSEQGISSHKLVIAN